MTKNFHFSFMFMAFALVACQKQDLKSPNDSSEIVLAKPTAPAPSTAKTLYLDVEVINSANLEPDGKGLYSHGKDRVQAVIWDNGDFYLQTNTNSNQNAIRLLVFSGTEYDAILNNVRNHSLRTEYLSADKELFQNMGEGASQNVGFRIFGEQKGGAVDWRLRYRYGPDATNEATAYAKITRVANKEWHLESLENHTANLVNGGGTHLNNLVIPFKFILKAR